MTLKKFLHPERERSEQSKGARRLSSRVLSPSGSAPPDLGEAISSNHGDLTPQIAGEQRLRDQRVHARTMSTTCVTRKLTAMLHSA